MKNKFFNYTFVPFVLIILFVVILFYPTIFPNYSMSKVDRTINNSFFENKKDENILLFFGYVGCVDVCTPRLKEISSIYDELKKEMEVKFYFINLTNSVSNKIANLFVKNFNEEFEGIQLEKKEREALKNEFNVFSVKSLSNDFDLDHTASLFFVQKVKDEYKLKRIFMTSRFEKETIVNSILGK